ncbi:VOC family protein [Vibrio pectenicida]|uniref:Glyoxalase/bleomycin resistance/dioxygenase family protein n=1 Tax=Vibrio pectenicida TaxID=62763 RepID=A0A3R9F944_9VIBR|nr:VOC family protein [Vibrio pectenicida]RSD31682.1 glyoxalase/bleomycin resistance/dioxygenase family protein [Vibrio pectenicida]
MHKPVALLVHVPDVSQGFKWYQKAFPFASSRYLPEFDFTVLDIEGFSLELVQADDKVPSGKSGIVLYWSVENLRESMDFLHSIGATLYRGPMEIKGGISICQMEDPFGNLIGLRGFNV